MKEITSAVVSTIIVRKSKITQLIKEARICQPQAASFFLRIIYRVICLTGIEIARMRVSVVKKKINAVTLTGSHSEYFWVLKIFPPISPRSSSPESGFANVRYPEIPMME